jgi:predicted CoA-binding protein
VRELITDEEIKQELQHTRSIAIVGISNKPDRPSYGVAQYLRDYTPYKIYFVNPLISEVFGEKVYPTLEALNEDLKASGESVDIVDVFRRVEDMEPVFISAIAIGAKTFWQQLGLKGGLQENPHIEINLISDRCIKIEYERLIRS